MHSGEVGSLAKESVVMFFPPPERDHVVYGVKSPVQRHAYVIVGNSDRHVECQRWPAAARCGDGRPSAIAVRLFIMNKCRYCEKIRDEWDCHGQACRRAIARALRRERAGLPMVPDVIRNEVPACATTCEVITVL